MKRQLLILGFAAASALQAWSYLAAQEFNTTEKAPNYSNTEQPSRGKSPPLPARPPLERQPRLTDPATDEDGQPLVATDDEETPRTPVASTRIAHPDRVLATWIALDNQQQAELAQVGAARSTQQGVKDFANGLVKDHTDLRMRLRAYAPAIMQAGFLNTSATDERDTTPAPATTRSIRDAAEQEAEETRRLEGTPVPNELDETEADATTPPPEPIPPETGEVQPGTIIDQPVSTTGQQRVSTRAKAIADSVEPMGSPRTTVARVTPERVPPTTSRDFNVEQVERELAVQELASSRKLLNQRRGTEFDRLFLYQQYLSHQQMRDKLIVYQRHVSGPLARVLAEAESMCEAHMQTSLDLLKDLPATTPVAQTPAKTRAAAANP